MMKLVVLIVVVLRLFAAAASEPLMVPLTLLEGAKAKGAVCLDGSPAAYHLHRGHGSGRNSWLIHLEGGAWCNTKKTCVERKTLGGLGSSKYMEKELPFTGILSNKAEENPDFFNWNRVKLRYCDGASFSGNGQLEGVQKNLPITCTSKLDPTSCFFPQNLIDNIKTPMFLLNAAYDSWQIKRTLVPPTADPHGDWNKCKIHHQNCNSSQIQVYQDFRNEMLNTLGTFSGSDQNGVFINSCFSHCQSENHGLGDILPK